MDLNQNPENEEFENKKARNLQIFFFLLFIFTLALIIPRVILILRP